MNLSSAKQLVPTINQSSRDPSAHVLASVVRMYEANARPVLGHTRNRGDVSGGGKKPWKQKGTGRARAGSTRSPLWRGGGTAHGPRSNRNYSLTLPDKLKMNALGIALALKADAGAILTVDTLPTDGKTKSLTDLARNQTLLVLDDANQAVMRASRNLSGLATKLAAIVNAKDVLKASRVVGTDAALKTLVNRVTRHESRVTTPSATTKVRTSKVVSRTHRRVD